MSHAASAVSAFQGLLDWAGESILVNSLAYTAQVSELTEDEVIVAGGKPNSGGFRAKCKLSDFPITPDQWTSIEAQGMALKIQSSKRYPGHIEFMAVDPAAE